MPGFNIAGGSGSNQKNNVAEPRRKHRWKVEFLGFDANSKILVYLQKAARPNFKYAPVEMHHDQEVAYFAGKQTWEPITFSFYDIEQDVDVSATLRGWVTKVTRTWADVGQVTAVQTPKAYKKGAIIQMTDGEGRVTEQWKLYGVWPMETNWQDLDYTSNDIAMVDVIVRMDRCIPGL